MSVARVLGGIADHNSAIRAAVLCHDGEIHAHLTEGYETLDTAAFDEYGRLLLATLEAVESAEDQVFRALFLEFETHSLLVRRIGAARLLLLMDPMRRGGFRKAEIGLRLFERDLERAVGGPGGDGAGDRASAAPRAAPVAAPSPAPTPPSAKSPAPAPSPPASDAPAASSGPAAPAPAPGPRPGPGPARAAFRPAPSPTAEPPAPRGSVPLRATQEAPAARAIPLRATQDTPPGPAVPLRATQDAPPASTVPLRATPESPSAPPGPLRLTPEFAPDKDDPDAEEKPRRRGWPGRGD